MGADVYRIAERIASPPAPAPLAPIEEQLEYVNRAVGVDNPWIDRGADAEPARAMLVILAVGLSLGVAIVLGWYATCLAMM